METAPDTPRDTLPSTDKSSFLNNIAFNFWHAPPDPDRPNLPYLPGFSIQITRHAPPPTFPTAEELQELGHQERPRLSEEYLRTVTHSEAVAANPPEEGLLSSPQAKTAQLVITSPIAIGAARGPQVVACRVTPQEGDPFTAVAKIYDPLYYNFENSIGYYPRDTVFEADENYAVETWAYQTLEKAGETGLSAPKFYGSWTFTLPIILNGVRMERPIRMILIERLNGVSIHASRVQNSYSRRAGKDAFHYPEEYRLEVLARAVDGYVRQMRAGVRQGDFTGRNIVLVPDEYRPTQSEMVAGLSLPRIVLVDYNNAYLEESPSDGGDPRPTNPAEAFWGAYLWSDIAGWVPSTWKNGEAQQAWLLERFRGDGQREMYRPVPAHIGSLPKSPGKETAAPETSSSRYGRSGETDEGPSHPPIPPDYKPERDHWNRPMPKLPMVGGSLFGGVPRREGFGK